MPANRNTRRKAGRSSGRRPAADSNGRRWASILTFLVIVGVVYFVSRAAKQPDNNIHDNIPQANELLAVKAPADLPAEIVEYTGYEVSFNPETHEPNWSAWEILPSETTGDASRTNKFMTDKNVEGCANTRDYTGSGFDRGHMAPAGDMKWSEKAMEESFYMTNICPQAGDLNRGTWQKLEDKCRQRAAVDSAVIVICGPIFEPGEGSQRIGVTGVCVPRRFFKVVLAPYAEVPYAIGFIMPNGPTPGGMQAYAVSVDSVESVTGYDFFSALPDDIEDALESKCDFNRFSRIPPRK